MGTEGTFFSAFKVFGCIRFVSTLDLRAGPARKTFYC